MIERGYSRAMSLARTGRLSAFGACVFVAAAVSGCGFGASPRLVIHDPQVPSETAQSAPAPSQAPARPQAPARTGGTAPAPSAVVAPGVILVRAGETLYTIARAHKVALRDLIDTNGLVAPYDLRAGQRLRLPPRHDHVVAAGDTVYGISRQYGVDMTSLVRLNELQPPYTIAVGQRLRIPAPTVTIAAPQPTQAVAAAPAAAVPAPQGPAAQAAGARVPGARVPAALAGAGSETLATVKVETLPPLPPSKPDQPGPEQASVEPTGPAPPAPLPKPSKATLPEASPAQESPAQPPPPDEAALDARVAAVEPSAAGANVAVAVPPPASAGPSFSWPLRGTIVSSFGSKKGGEHNDGINIAARRGAPVRAADDGVVVYAGNELRGFGNLVLVRHADGWTTAYAHNETLLVKRGDRVRRGQVIAKAGSSGSVATPQLHFEIRRGRRAVDPAEYLTAAAGPSVSLSPVASRDGRRGPE